jgi:hypothetical protein
MYYLRVRWEEEGAELFWELGCTVADEDAVESYYLSNGCSFGIDIDAMIAAEYKSAALAGGRNADRWVVGMQDLELWSDKIMNLPGRMPWKVKVTWVPDATEY